MAMSSLFYLKVKVGKTLANIVSASVRNRERRHRLRNRLNPLNPKRCVRYIRRHYVSAEPIAPVADDRQWSPVWVCWLQGLDEAPQLVVNCIRSIERFKYEEQEVVVVTSANYAQYVELPDYVVRKWQQGIISNIHFSDILRIHLLARHGGCWIDATCLLTAPVPRPLVDSPLFLFRSHGEFSYTYIQSCFICAQKNNYVLRKWCGVIDAYWSHETMTLQYFLLHLTFVAILRSDTHFREAFYRVPALSDAPMHVLLPALVGGARYTKKLMEKARQASFVQKLTYKFTPALLDEPQSLAYVLSKRPSGSQDANKKSGTGQQ